MIGKRCCVFAYFFNVKFMGVPDSYKWFKKYSKTINEQVKKEKISNRKRLENRE